jgi:hypothetical protein
MSLRRGADSHSGVRHTGRMRLSVRGVMAITVGEAMNVYEGKEIDRLWPPVILRIFEHRRGP